jgi:hypothetical protein
VSTPGSQRKDKRPEPLRPGVLAFLALALLLCAGSLFWALREPAPPEPPPSTRQQVLRPPTPGPSRARRAEDPPPLSETAPEPEDGEPTGMQLYPPNVKPIRRGLVVPEGYELPPGYLRHYQANEDGTLLPPILAFHPDYQPVDAAGRPIAVGPGRVVPPELAPAGFPLQTLEVPPPDFTDRGADGGA